ncbi:MAG: YhjD/YihY/BrkB family envelope integrity protein [Gordonia sp. (in: high G+C Gram-positive bacteria)]
MSSVNTAKAAVSRGKEQFTAARQRWEWLDHALRTVERYGAQRGNLYAASITFNGILAVVPIIMVIFAIGATVLARHPQYIDDIKDQIVTSVPGDLGKTLQSAIDSAIKSRAAVGVIGLVGATLTGIGWISGVRVAMTEMYGGRVDRNPLLSKVFDLLAFVSLGVAFLVTIGLTTLGNSGLIKEILEWLHLDGASWTQVVARVAAILISVFASWILFSVVLSRLPLQGVPLRNVLKASLATAVIFEILKSVGGIYLKSVLSSPAGAAFGPILGVMVFAYLATRIILYATAWCATDRVNKDYQVVDKELEKFLVPVVVRPSYEVNPVPKAGAVAAAVAIGAAVSAATGWLLRR